MARLRDAEKLQAQGATIPQVCKKLGVSEQTFYRWRAKCGALKEDEAIRLKTLEQENVRLKGSGQKARGDDSNSTRRLPARYRNHIWSYDFTKRGTSDGRPARVLNVIDEFTRVGLGSHVARRIGAKGVRAHLERPFAVHGKPTLSRADNGREFTADSLLDWLGEQEVRGVFIAKASPWQNGINERFNGTLERELFGHEVYHSILEVQFDRRRLDREVQHHAIASKPERTNPGRIREDAQGSDSVRPIGGGSR